jgi:RNA-directed DNA polymerase
MSEKQRNIQGLLAFPEPAKGEAPSGPVEGSESPVAKREHESLASTRFLMEEVCQQDNLKAALGQVKANKGKPGIDGMTVKELPGYFWSHWPEIRAQLLGGTYEPKPVLRVDIPKPGGGVRKLGIPCVVDRVIQQAVLRVLQPRWDPTFSEFSYGFRPKRSAHQAIAQAQDYVRDGYRIVVDLDLEKFFDRVNHDILMGRIAKRVSDKRMLKLIRAFLKAGVLDCGLVQPTKEGTPQGGPLSPLLSNLMLDDLDRELEKRGHRFVRYADDCNIYVRTERAGHRVMESVERFITGKLKLKVNREKSAVARVERRKFLSFTFLNRQGIKRRIAPQAVKRFKQKIRKRTRRTVGRSIQQIIDGLTVYMRGWLGYFGYCETPSTLRELDSWIRRRLRAIIWKQWKRGRTRYARLRKRGVRAELAVRTAASPKGPWRIALSPAMTIAFPNAFFDKLGLLTMGPKRNA